MHFKTIAFGTALSFALLAGIERDAAACGGCFIPSENNTVVTDHRMVLSIDLQQSTLYDQIRYQGSPESFAWVLPIRGEAKVGVSADVVFSVLDVNTSVQVLRPPTNCPPPPYCPDDNERSASASGGSADASVSPVSVLKEETVGPYETVQLRSSDPTALRTWLADRGFQVPAAVTSVIDSYIDEKFDFLAVKLVPGQGVQSMVPIRVTTPGASPQLPLRMVAAGTGSNVGITLWTIADGRWEPQNFPSFVVKQEDLVWDWTTSSSNFKSVRAAKVGQLGAGAWESESSIRFGASNLENQIERGQFRGNDGTSQYQPVKDGNGNVIKTAQQVFDEDMIALFGSANRTVRVTRLRADLPQASLSNDLSLQASTDQSELSRVRQVSREANQPNCPVYSGCKVVGTAPRDLAAGSYGATLGGGGCATGSTPESRDAWGSGVGLLCAVGIMLATRRRSTH